MSGGQIKATTSMKPPESEPATDFQSGDNPDAVYASLRSFYTSQASGSNSQDPLLTPSGGYNYSSPSSLARIMSLYTGRASYGKKDSAKSSPMRESANSSEGLQVVKSAPDEEAIQTLQSDGWTGTASTSQQAEQRHPPRFVQDLRPSQILLRTKRSKRCQVCRHILVKPEAKVQNTRFKIRLVALNYIPNISLKPLQLQSSAQSPPMNLDSLPALRPIQFLLTLKNPLFEPVKVTLAAQSHTPGRYSNKVTILCPQFDIGPNVDQWDEALGDGKNHRASKSLTAPKAELSAGEGGRVAEAGKVWEKGRNWVTVVVEVVCAVVEEGDDQVEDEDVLEIPIFVRMEWEADIEREGGEAKGDDKREKRELAYWAVVGVGRVGKLEARSPEH